MSRLAGSGCVWCRAVGEDWECSALCSSGRGGVLFSVGFWWTLHPLARISPDLTGIQLYFHLCCWFVFAGLWTLIFCRHLAEKGDFSSLPRRVAEFALGCCSVYIWNFCLSVAAFWGCVTHNPPGSLLFPKSAQLTQQVLSQTPFPLIFFTLQFILIIFLISIRRDASIKKI